MTSSRSARRLLRLLLVASVMLVASAFPSAASADTLYATTGQGNNSATLYTLDPNTGAPGFVGSIMIGATQVTHLTGLAIDPTDGTMYGFANGDFCCDPDFEDGTLMTINKATGAATVIGTLGGVPLRASDITFDRFGTLYAWSAGCGNDQDCDTNASDLFTLDTTTAVATKVGESGTVGFGTGVASDSKGRMYMKDFDALFRVNPFTGHVFAPTDLSSCCVDNLLSFGPSDVLYTGDRTGSGLQLKTLNPATGNLSNVGVPNGIQAISAIDWDFTTPTTPDEADLSIDLSVTDSAPTAETDVTFTVTVTNDGPDSAVPVVVTELPSGFSFVSDNPSQGSYDDSTGLWNVNPLAASTSATLEIVATVHSTGLHTHTAEVTSDGTYDTDSVPGSSEGDTFASARSAPAGATTLYASTGVPGSAFCGHDDYADGSPSSLYELDPSDGDVRKIADIVLPIATQAYHVSGLAVHPSTGVLYGFMNTQEPIDCNFTPSGPGTLITINKTTGAATVVGSMDAAAIAATDIAFDPFGTLYAWNKADDDLYTIDYTTTGAATPVADCGCGPGGRLGLAIDSVGRMYLKTAIDLFRVNQFSGGLFGSVFTANSAPRDMLAAGPGDMLYTGSRESPNFTSPQTFSLWTIDPSNGATTLLGSNLVQDVSALAWDLGTITPPDEADLSLDKTVDDATPDNWFQNVTFTITVSNAGPDDATGVEVKDQLPSGLTYVSDNSASTSTTYNSTTGIWNAGTITNGNSKALQIVASVQPNGSYANTAEVTDSSTYDTDSVPGSGGGDTIDSETLTPTPTPGVDLLSELAVSGPSKTTATSKGFAVLIRNVGSQTVTVTGGNLILEINGNGGAASCKSFSSTLKPGRSVRAHCSANLSILGLSPGNTVTYESTVDLPADGFTFNDTDTENRTAS